MNATLYSYGFPAGVSRTRSDAPVFRSFAYHGEAQSGKTDRVWYVSSGLAPVPGGMSGSGGYSLVDNKPESVLVGTALFDLNRLAALPPNYAHMALFERIHKDMILRLVSEAS